MAAANSLMAEENFQCSICLGVFNKPVSIPCGHNFCLDCITDYWDSRDRDGAVIQCPLCNEKFYQRPMLRVNTFIAQMAAKIRMLPQDEPRGAAGETGSGEVLCDTCEGRKLAAIKSCLVCLASYCETHLERHQRVAALKKHKLIQPVQNIESRMCEDHHEEFLELFCRAEQKFVCASCKDGEHRTHKVVSLEEEARTRKAQLEKEKDDMEQMSRERQEKIREFRDSVQASRNNAPTEQACAQVMTTLVDYIKRSQGELTQVIQRKQEKMEKETEGYVTELEGEITQIKQRKSELDQVSVNSDNPFEFLNEMFARKAAPLPRFKDWSDVVPTNHQHTLPYVLTKLEATVTREISMLCDPDFREMRWHTADVTLDPDTANPSLVVSEDGKQVSHVDRKRNLPNKPERFDSVLNVLAKEGFSSGMFYYEVLVRGKTQWDLGVANRSINRKGDIRLSPKNGYWTVWLRKGSEFTANAGPAIDLHPRELPQKVGVFVDYTGGRVSFYDADTAACIYSFAGCNFTEKLFPFFSPGANDGGKNSAPLVITRVIPSNS